jgi:thymidylate kinase
MLTICHELFSDVSKKEINYCHWKSNSHLDKALSGQTDLDLLVNARDEILFKQVLDNFKFKEILSPLEKRFPGLEDYLGFDQKTGKLVHLHIHYKLVLGERYIKNHHLPIENLVLNNLRLRDGVYIPIPEIELMLLILRMNMKVDSISLVKHFIRGLQGIPYTAYPSDIEDEFIALCEEHDPLVLKKIVKESNLSIDYSLYKKFIHEFTSNNLSALGIIKYRNKILHGLSDYRRESGIHPRIKYFIFSIKELPVIRRVFPAKKKTLPNDGLSVSLVGADGSGKSTHVADLSQWLSWKMAVTNYYYGIPKSFLIKVYSLFLRIMNKMQLNSINEFFQNLLLLYISRSRYRISKKIQNDKKRGLITISDRFPLKYFQSMSEPMDGPKIRKNNKLNNYLAVLERRNYEKIVNPDCILVLKVTLNELRKRKTDLDLNTHKQKATAVNSLEDDENIITIDANKPYHEVQLLLRSELWKRL